MSEVAPYATREQAEARRDRIKAGLATLWDDIKAAWRERDWVALGYPSWDAMCEAEYRLGLALPRDERPEVVADLRREGMSTRAIAAATGASHMTVQRDLASVTDVPVATVTSLDGRQRPATRPQPEVLTADEFAQRYHAGLQDEPELTDDEQALKARLEAGETVVVNMRDDAHARLWEWAVDNDQAVRVDRKSIWGNPFVLGDDGDRDTVCDLYADVYLPHKPALRQALPTLLGKALGCWCAPARCHADTLRERAMT